MIKDELISLNNCRVDTVRPLSKFHTTIDILRLDLIHPVISGNKWFKLQYYLEDAKGLDKKIIVTFGGAYSNHIVATAAAAKQEGLKSIGIIRGEMPTNLSLTLKDAMDYGMQLYFISREDYKIKKLPSELSSDHNKEKLYIINEGGYGHKGMEGSKKILDLVNLPMYSHIVAAVGTGTTLSGLIEASLPQQQIIGISVLKNNSSLLQEIEPFISPLNKKRFSLIHDYAFGGYAKSNARLTGFMNQWFQHTGIPSDFVYTGKLFFAVNELIQKNYFSYDSGILVIHSGGLQGNRSLPKGTLIF